MVKIRKDWVEFVFYRPGVDKVFLAGDFNDWRAGELPMVSCGGGYWVAKMRLPAGEFKFRYFADGEWFTDYAAFGVEPGRFGWDSVVRIPQASLKLTQPAVSSADAGGTTAAA